MKRFKYYSILLALILSVSMVFAACGNKDDDGSAASESEAAAEQTEETTEPEAEPAGDPVSQIVSILGCINGDAKEIFDTMTKAIGAEPVSIADASDADGKMLMVTDANGTKYYAKFTDDNFMTEIAEGSPDGETVYVAVPN